MVFLKKNKTETKKNILLCKNVDDGNCIRRTCIIYDYDKILTKLSKTKLSKTKLSKTKLSKTKLSKIELLKKYDKFTDYSVTTNENLNLCLNNPKYKKIIQYNKPPQYRIFVNNFNYTRNEAFIASKYKIIATDIYNTILKLHNASQNYQKLKFLHKFNYTPKTGITDGTGNTIHSCNFKIHILVGSSSSFIKMFDIKILEKDLTKVKKANIEIARLFYNSRIKLINQRYNFDKSNSNTKTNTNMDIMDIMDIINIDAEGLVINITTFIYGLHKIKSQYKISFDPFFNDLYTIIKSKNIDYDIYILGIRFFFGVSSFYFMNEMSKLLGNKLLTVNVMGSCGGVNKKNDIGNIIIANKLSNWKHIIQQSINKNIYENILNNIDTSTDLYNILKNTSDINIMIDKSKLYKSIYKYATPEYKKNIKTHINIGNLCTVSLIPYENNELMTEFNNKNILGIEMEDYWIGCGLKKNQIGLFVHYISDLPTEDEYHKSVTRLLTTSINLQIIKIILSYII